VTRPLVTEESAVSNRKCASQIVFCPAPWLKAAEPSNSLSSFSNVLTEDPGFRSPFRELGVLLLEGNRIENSRSQLRTLSDEVEVIARDVLVPAKTTLEAISTLRRGSAYQTPDVLQNLDCVVAWRMGFW